jgi:hypothetical protein
MQTTSSEQHPLNDPLAREVVKHFELYPSAQLSAATIPAWKSELSDVPAEILGLAFAKAREASPQFPATAAQVKAIAIVEAARIEYMRAERRQERLFPEPKEQQSSSAILQAFYSACDKALQVCGPEIGPEQTTAIVGIVVLLLRHLGSRGDAGMMQFGRWVVNDAKQRKVKADQVVRGLRRAPLYLLKPPTMGMLTTLMREEPMGGWPQDHVQQDGRALEVLEQRRTAREAP